MFHSQTMAPYFVLPRKHDKFEFKTTIERNGIVLARPCAKIVKKSRNSVDKIMQSKAISSSRVQREDYEPNESYENYKPNENYEPQPTYAEYLTYCSLENSCYSYGDDFDDFEDFQLSFADYCDLQTQTQPQTKPQKKYSPPKIRPDSDVEVFHWPKVVHSPKRTRLTYAQMAM